VHDVPEVGPPGDLLGPLVAHLKETRANGAAHDEVLAIREKAERAVYTRCGVLDVFEDPDQLRIVKKLDAAMCAAEKRDMLRGCADIELPEWAPPDRIVPMAPGKVLVEYRWLLGKYAPLLAAEFREGMGPQKVNAPLGRTGDSE